MKRNYSTPKIIKRVILSILIISLLSLIAYPFVYRKINNYNNYIINKQCAINYVNYTYGYNFKITDLYIGSFDVAVFETSGYYGFDVFRFTDTNNIEPDFRIEVFKGKISRDYYYNDRTKNFYESHINRYIQNHIFDDQYTIEVFPMNLMLGNGEFEEYICKKYNNYEEIVSNDANTQDWDIVVYILIYDNNPKPKNYKWIDDLYEDLTATKYKEFTLELNFSNDKEAPVYLNSGQYRRVLSNGEITQDTLSKFLNEES